jgi:glycosyltransferase involved in cell wall biosynthesis
MKVLIYTECFLPSLGGVQTAADLLARGLAELDGRGTGGNFGRIEVTVATNTPPGAMDDSRCAYRVVRRPGIWRLLRLIRETDVVHLAGPCFVPMVLTWLSGTPMVIEHHGYQAICPNGLLFQQPMQTACAGHFMEKNYSACLRCRSAEVGFIGGIGSLLLTFPRRWLCKKAAANIAITNHVRDRILLPHAQTVYYGTEENRGGTRHDSPAGSSVLEIAYVGRLVAEKGLPVLVDTAKSLRDHGVAFHLSFIGDGPERVRLRELVSRFELDDFVSFTGDLRDAALREAAGKIAAVVMPSIWEETAGLSAIEQMMRSGVVIASDIGGLGEVVDDAGLKFPPRDSEALATCLRRLIDDPSLLASLGSAARARAARYFRHETMVEGHFDVYQKVLHQ